MPATIESYFSDIADAIRERGSTSAGLTPAQMPQAILDIPGGGGGAPLYTQSEWNALSTAEKQALEYAGIITESVGFKRGVLVYGADYLPQVVTKGTYDVRRGEGVVYTASVADAYNIFIMAISSQDATYNQEMTVSVGNNVLTPVSTNYFARNSATDNQCNCRINKYKAVLNVGESFSVAIANIAGNTRIIAFITSDNDYNTLTTALSRRNANTTYTGTVSGLVLYGGFNGGSSSVSSDIYLSEYQGTSASITATPPTGSSTGSFIYIFS